MFVCIHAYESSHLTVQSPPRSTWTEHISSKTGVRSGVIAVYSTVVTFWIHQLLISTSDVLTVYERSVWDSTRANMEMISSRANMEMISSDGFLAYCYCS